MSSKPYDGTSSLALNLVVAATLTGGTMLASDNRQLYRPSVQASYTYAMPAAATVVGYPASPKPVIKQADGLDQMRQLAKNLVENTKGIDAEIGAAVEENFFDWL